MTALTLVRDERRASCVLYPTTKRRVMALPRDDFSRYLTFVRELGEAWDRGEVSGVCRGR